MDGLPWSRQWLRGQPLTLLGRRGSPTPAIGSVDAERSDSSSADSCLSHITAEDLPQNPRQAHPDIALAEDSSDIEGPDFAISESGNEPVLVRCGYQDSVNDYSQIFQRLQLRRDFYDGFFEYIKEHRKDEEVLAVLADGSDQGVKDVAGEFLERYGRRIWKTKGKFCKQDKTFYGHTLFDIKSDSDMLIPILDELWFRVRGLIFINTNLPSENSEVSTEHEIKVAKEPPFVPRYPMPFTTPAPTDTTLDLEEEKLAVEFINKIRVDVHKLPGDVKPRSGHLKD